MVCNCKNYKEIYNLQDHKIVRCSDCGLVKTLGKSELDYANYHRDMDYLKYARHFENIFNNRYKIISKFTKKGKMLEIGSSTGGLLGVFKKHGWEVEGVEPSSAGKTASSKGIKTYAYEFEEVKLKHDNYDLVVLNHTLEHITDPFFTLKKVHKILRPGGIVYIDVPNFGSLSRIIARDNWKYLLPEEHIWHFEKSSLSMMMKTSGFDIEWWGSWSGVFDISDIRKHFVLAWRQRKTAFFADLVDIPNNVFATAFKMGTNLAMIGIKK